MNPARWTKAQVVFFTQALTWCGSYITAEWLVAAISVPVTAYLAWLAPNEPAADPPVHLRRESSGN